MENKTIVETELGPAIEMDSAGKIIIKGKSMMEDASLYYEPCHTWSKEYIQHIQNPLTVEIDLSYFNSSSAKQLMKLLMNLDESSVEASVVWIYPHESDVLFERGQELEIMLDLPFVFQPK